MQIHPFFFKLYKVGPDRQPIAFLGSAFPVRPNGGMLTCRHVVDLDLKDGEAICLLDEGQDDRMVIVEEKVFSSDPTLDISYLPDALQRTAQEYFPILPPNRISMGEDVYSFGAFLTGRSRDATQNGYFKGNIVCVNQPSARTADALTLSYPVVEGLSGSPVLTYHNGPKVVGLAFGSTSSRITASEVLEYEDDRVKLRETVLRIIEFGLAYGSDALLRLDRELGIGLDVTDGRPDIPGLE